MFLLYGFRLRVQTGRLRNKTLEFSGKIEQSGAISAIRISPI